jgi:murein DD-endopeptidase MepM/ murein hydrolase activator NlpD
MPDPSLIPRPLVVVLALALLCGVACHPVADAPRPAAGGTSRVASGNVAPVRYVLPVDAPVVDAFRAPSHRYGPGNRGWEFATRGGEPVRAVGSGVVVFAGQVAGRGVVSIQHPDGLRSSVTGLLQVTASAGVAVSAGETLGVAGPGLHLGFRRRGEYLDPALVYGLARHAYLVPVP